MEGVISAIKPHSIASTLDIKVGDKLASVNGQKPKDIIELSFLLSEENIALTLIDGKTSKEKVYTFKKDLDEDLGLEFASAVFDKVQLCHNKCVFCFVDQMMPNLRKSLYVRDDDYRLSFLYGNFITLTNMKDKDYERIIKTHMSPLYVSIHATDPKVRSEMMHNKFAGDVLKNLKRLTDAGIEVHTQIVLCPSYNDGKVLEKTFHALLALYPMVQSMAVVPVGITKNREGLPKMRLFTSKECKDIIKEVKKWQDLCRKKMGKTFIYLGDEFYVAAGEELPSAKEYDGFPQIENGIGLSRNFIDEWEQTNISSASPDNNAIIPVGESAYKVLNPLIKDFNKKYKTKHVLMPVVNNFFGTTINVTGLLTASDISSSLTKLKEKPQRLLLPDIVLNKDELFLDDVTFKDFVKANNLTVEKISSAKELKKQLSK